MQLRLLLLRGAAACLALAASAMAAEVRVSAAASLADALQEIAPAYEQASGDKLVFHYGASSTLARQIQEGAPADVFFSADEPKMDSLEQSGLLLEGTRRSLLGNSLVVVVPAKDGAVIAQADALLLPGIRRLAVAEPATVPAGIYARAYLIKLGLWEKLAPKLVPTENVRAALAAVVSGNADAAWVYKTDAGISKEVKITLEVPPAQGPRISYPVAVVKPSKQPEAARKFVTWLSGPEATVVFRKFGFEVLP